MIEAMLFLKLYIRSIRNKWPFYAIAWMSLLIGLVFSIGMLLGFRLSFFHDRHNIHYDRIYELYNNVYQSEGRTNIWNTSSIDQANVVRMQIPEVEAVTQYTGTNASVVLKIGERSVTEWGCYVDSFYSKVFTLKIICGNIKNAFRDPLSIVLTQTTSKKLFGGANPLGETVRARFNNRVRLLKVTAVVDDCPIGASNRYAFLVPIQTYYQVNPGDLSGWGNCAFTSAVLLNRKANFPVLEARLHSINSKRGKTDSHLLAVPYLRATSISFDADGQPHNFRLIDYTVALVLALLFILIASFNYCIIINSLAFDRMKEAGINKINGASRWRVFLRLMSETALSLLVIFIIAIPVTKYLGDVTNDLIIPVFSWSTLMHPFILWTFILVFVISLLITSLFPSLLISSVRINNLLKNTLIHGSSRSPFRVSVLVIQLAVGSLLVFLTLGSQYISSMSLSDEWGINRKNVWVVTTAAMNNKDVRAIKAELLRTPGIDNVSCLMINGAVTNAKWTGMKPDNQVEFEVTNVDSQFDSVMNLQISRGRFFENISTRDSFGIVINETAAKRMGLKNPIGAKMNIWKLEGTIVGVVKDFRYGPMDRLVAPVVLLNERSKPYNLLIKSKLPEEWVYRTTLRVYRKYEQDFSIQFQSYTQRFILSNGSVSTTKTMFLVYSVVVLFITCIGILAFTALTVQRRTKEIGIRKANGASAFDILFLLSRSTFFALFMGLLISIPAAYLILVNYYSLFAYSPPIPIWIFLVGIAFVLLVVISTTILQSWRVATRNPVEALRYE
jgi:putative ABC transport system permease protein